MTKFINPLDIPQLNILVSQKSGLTINEKGVDSMSYIIREVASLKWLKSLGYEALEDYQNTAVSQYVDKRLAYEKTTQKGYTQTGYEPIATVLKLISERGLSSYIILYKNINETIKEATKQRKSKDTFALLEIHGLDQPSKNITVNTMKMLSKIIKRKAFKLHSYDLAQDILKHGKVNQKTKESFKKIFFSDKCINEKNTVYINKTNIPNIGAIKYYDKYIKESQNQEIDEDLKEWKRLEVTVVIPRDKRKCAFDYFHSVDFQEDLAKVNEVSKKLNIETENNYLNYQLNTLCDTRGLNNKPLETQFNSVEELEKFKNKEITRNFTIGA
jgi:hypothetical protein